MKIIVHRRHHHHPPLGGDDDDEQGRHENFSMVANITTPRYQGEEPGQRAILADRGTY